MTSVGQRECVCGEGDKLGEVICVKYCVEAFSASISNVCSIPI